MTYANEVEALRSAVAAVREQAGGRRCNFPKPIRRQAVALLDQGAAATSLARATGLRADVLRRWERRSRVGKKPPPVKAQQAVEPAPRVFAVEAPHREPAAATEVPPLRLQVGAFVITVALATGAT